MGERQRLAGRWHFEAISWQRYLKQSTSVFILFDKWLRVKNFCCKGLKGCSMAERNEVIAHLDIPSLVQDLIPSSKLTGNDFLGLCPFHDDHHPSLSIQSDSGMYRCYACGATGSVFDLYSKIHGLDFKKSIQELTIQAGLSNEYTNPSTDAVKSKEVDRHEYKDADGNVLYLRLRYEPGEDGRSKKYYFYDPSTNAWKRPCAPVLYNLPNVVGASTVIICEGERKADVLIKWGMVGTSFDSGAESKITDAMVTVLTGKSIIIVPDNDESGRKYRDKTISAMEGKAASIKVVELPDLDDKGDIVDWIKTTGNDKDRFLQLANGTKEWVPEANSVCIAGTPITGIIHGIEEPEVLTDQRVKDFFVDVYKTVVRYVPNVGWHYWDSRRWITDMHGGLHPFIEKIQQYMMMEASKIPNETDRLERKRALLGLESHTRKVTLIESFKNAPLLIVSHDQLDRDQMLLNCQNGTVDLRTGGLRLHSSADMITRMVNAEYDPQAECPTFMAFLTWAMCGDLELVSYLQRFIGYCLTGMTTEQVLNFWYGTGGNGKSTLMNVLQWLLSDYAATADTSLIMKRSNGSDNNKLVMLAGLRGARAVTLSEVNDGEKLDEAAIKSFTGGDVIAARRLYNDFIYYTPTAKLIGFGNYKPHVRGTDNGIWRRIHLIRFAASITDDTKDPNLADKLRMELSGILSWAVRGCLEWQQIGLAPPPAILDAVKEYREEEDLFQCWLNECCRFDKHVRTPASDLIASYKDYSGWHNISAKKFGDLLRSKGFEKGTSNGVYWIGLAVHNKNSDFKPDLTEHADSYAGHRNSKYGSKVGQSAVGSGEIFDYS